MFSDSRKETISLTLNDGSSILLEAALAGREDVAFEQRNFADITNTLESLALSISSSLQKATPSKATIKFGLRFQTYSGSLIGVIVEGTESSSFEVTLEWNRNG